MRNATCSECGNETPIGESWTCDGRIICSSCLNTLEDDGIFFEREAPNIDPSICAYCGRDDGNDELPLDRGRPICDTCYHSYMHRPFPAWVKVFGLAVVAVVAAGMVANARFFLADSKFHAATAAYGQGKLAEAAADMAEAAQRVPESPDLRDLASYFKGVDLLSLNKSEEALPYLQATLKHNPSNKVVQMMVYEAQIGAAFDKKDYAFMYATSKKLVEMYPSDPTANLQVASSAACLYVSTSKESYRAEARKIIGDVEKSATTQQKPSVDEYVRRIQYRLQSKQIIDTAEYYRRFPDQKKE